MGYYKKLYNKLYYYIAVCILSVSPVLAEGDTNNNSNPVAVATGNVTNQAVQFQNNGAPSRQAFGNNISCNGSTMTFSPFYMGNDTEPQTEDGYVISENWGFQINFSVPLQNDYKTTTNAQFLGKQTSKVVIDKKNLNLNIISLDP